MKTAKEFLETKTLTLSKDIFDGYKITYSYLNALLEEYAQLKVNEINNQIHDLDNRIGINNEIKLRNGFRNGEVAIKYNELDHKKIELFLKKEFPKYTATFSGVCKFYICNYSKTTWLGVDRIHDSTKAVTINELCDGPV